GRGDAGRGEFQRRDQADEGEEQADTDEIAMRRGEEPRRERPARDRLQAQILVRAPGIEHASLGGLEASAVIPPGRGEARVLARRIDASAIAGKTAAGAERAQ